MVRRQKEQNAQSLSAGAVMKSQIVTELKTKFAPAEKATAGQVSTDNKFLLENGAAKALLDGFPEPAAVLNQQRQIILANNKLATLLGRSPESLLGLRPGEAFDCLHWNDCEGGCGTSESCRLCGAVNAIMNSQKSSLPDVQECRTTSVGPQGEVSFDFQILASPFDMGPPFTIFACRDISHEKRREVLERIFFHDILNSAGNVKGLIEILPRVPAAKVSEILSMALNAAQQLVDDIQAGRDLTLAERNELQVNNGEVNVPELLSEVCTIYRHHPLGIGKHIGLAGTSGETTIWSDETLLRRILGNLIKNALEAEPEGEKITVSFENAVLPVFQVHNRSAMPEDVSLQIFQRSFTTKGGNGRGIGTYSIRLLAERYLGGRVEFSSTPEKGTTFRVHVPSRPLS